MANSEGSGFSGSFVIDSCLRLPVCRLIHKLLARFLGFLQTWPSLHFKLFCSIRRSHLRCWPIGLSDMLGARLTIPPTVAWDL